MPFRANNLKNRTFSKTQHGYDSVYKQKKTTHRSESLRSFGVFYLTNRTQIP